MPENLEELGDWVNRPEELTRLLYKGLLLVIADTKGAMERRNYEEANHLCQKAYEIVRRLDAGLNYDAGPLADRLNMLYTYCADAILEADLEKKVEPLQVVETIITQLDEAWEQAVAVERQRVEMGRGNGRASQINPYIDQENRQEVLRHWEKQRIEQRGRGEEKDEDQ